MTQEQLQDFIEAHKKWRENKKRSKLDERPELPDKNLRGLNLSGAFLESVDMSSADLRDTDWSGAEMSWAKLPHADLRGANLSRTAYIRTNCRWAGFRGANLEGANLSGAMLIGANFSFANLRNANMFGINAEDAIMDHADISGADLRGAQFRSVDFGNAGVIADVNTITDEKTIAYGLDRESKHERDINCPVCGRLYYIDRIRTSND